MKKSIHFINTCIPDLVNVILLVLSSLIILSYFYLYPVYAQETSSLFITQGIASGDVTASTAVIWSRANRQAQMHVEYDTDHNFSNPKSNMAIADRTTDFTAQTKPRRIDAGFSVLLSGMVLLAK